MRTLKDDLQDVGLEDFVSEDDLYLDDTECHKIINDLVKTNPEFSLDN